MSVLSISSIVRRFSSDSQSAVTMIELCDSPLRGDWIRTCMGLFLSSGRFWFLPVLCSELGKPFFVPSPAIRFAERAEGVKGPKR